MIDVQFSKGQLDAAQQTILTSGFEAHSKESAAPSFQKERINWLAYDADEHLIGALTADALWDWIYIDELWVDKRYRGDGFGKKLMTLAEEYAIGQDMTGLWLWTQSWQAARFYEQLGYKEFARFKDFPKGHDRIGFRKQVKAGD